MTDRRLRIALAALAAAGVAIAGYLTATRLAGAAPICATSGCETVQRSRYSEIFGVPVAVLGLVSYVLLLASAARTDPRALAAGAAVALAGAGFALYLLVVQLAAIHAICTWCVASDVVLWLLTPVVVLRLRTLLHNERLWTRASSRPSARSSSARASRRRRSGSVSRSRR